MDEDYEDIPAPEEYEDIPECSIPSNPALSQAGITCDCQMDIRCCSPQALPKPSDENFNINKDTVEEVGGSLLSEIADEAATEETSNAPDAESALQQVLQLNEEQAAEAGEQAEAAANELEAAAEEAKAEVEDSTNQ